ncbi:MAG: lysine 5,6-aminomutase subunit alpha, partial [Victivallales bacterium]|nr:lysine 5,6-aminomutase subunit alpha [Victivallales bacterium]
MKGNRMRTNGVFKSKLGLSENKIAEARKLASKIVKPVEEYIRKNTTDSTERATLRMLGADGANRDGVPVPNIISNQLSENLGRGAARYYINALLKKGLSVEELNTEIINGLDISKIDLVDFEYIQEKGNELVNKFDRKVSGNVKYRTEKINSCKNKENSPLLYLIVATGNIYEDVKQAQAAANQGADVIA